MRTLTALLVLAGLSPAADSKLVVKPDAFATLVNPNCSHCVDEAKRRKDELKDTDPVLMWTRGKYNGGAIPIRFFLNPYRVISDTYGVFVYDPDAGFARGFTASVDFRFHGWRNGVMVMRHKDGTLYSCLTGLAFDGPRKGERLTPWPTLTTNWGWVMSHYPSGVAYHMFEKYQPTELPQAENADSVKSRGEPDKRLPADEVVLGVYPGGRAKPRAFRLRFPDVKADLLADTFECGRKVVVLYQADGDVASAYEPVAERHEAVTELSVEGKVLESKTVTLHPEGVGPARFVDAGTGSRFDPAGRCVEGPLKGWTLRPYDAVKVKWFAWAAEHPTTTISQAKEPAAPPPAKVDPKDAIKEVAGTAEFLRSTPKHAAEFLGFDPKARTVTLLLEGEKVPKAWPLLPDAEVKASGWWGRPDQFSDHDKVWVWFAADRKKNPRAILMLADDASEKDVHGKAEALPKDFAGRRAAQRAGMALFWEFEGLPGTVTFAHVAGEVEVMLDHEAMRWGRSLKLGDAVELADPDHLRPLGRLPVRPFDLSTLSMDFPYTPMDLLRDQRKYFTDQTAGAVRVKAVVKDVRPWRERTRVTLVVNGVDIAPFESGKRTFVKMPPPPKDVQDGDYPPDIGGQRTKEERIEWFLASIYCTCKVGGDICTGDFYTLASCNPNGCGAPNMTRKRIAELIDKGMDDKQIFDDLRAERGPLMSKPHLRP